MQATILQKIVADKRQWVAAKEASFPLANFQAQIQPSDRDFYAVLAQAKPNAAFILECKKASPSKGLIRADFNLEEIANVYRHYASAISVLTDEAYFQGDFAYLEQVRAIAPQPILCKDFIVSPYQIYLARHHKADAILLMLSVLNDDEYRTLSTLAHSLKMGVLTEAATADEVARAVALGVKVIGINNRNLHDLSIDTEWTLQLAQTIPSDRLVISESGIYTQAQIQHLRQVADGFLVGSSLMSQPNLDFAVRKLIFGEHKICGLTRAQDVQTAYAAGACYGGLIFAEKSPRCLSLRQAQELVVQTPLQFVGVFQDQAVDFIAKLANQLGLFAVQLHGNESDDFIRQLRQALPANCQIWRAVSLTTDLQISTEITPLAEVDRYVFDSKVGTQQGGTGQVFNWDLIPETLKANAMLAGGISLDNLDQALAQGCVGLDFNSGVEERAGVKSEEKIRAVFARIQQFVKGNKR